MEMAAILVIWPEPFVQTRKSFQRKTYVPLSAPTHF